MLNLQEMTVEALVALRDDVQSTINAKVADERRSLQERMAQLSIFEGGEPGDKVGHPTKGRVVEPTHRDPATGKTWAGRGQAPSWLREYEAVGRSREEFQIRR